MSTFPEHRIRELEKLYTNTLDELSQVKALNADLLQQLQETVDLAEACGAPEEELEKAWTTLQAHSK